MATISGTVHLRPARAGFVWSHPQEAALIASDLACSAWGGMYCPLIWSDADNQRRMTEALAIDFYQAVDDAPNSTALSESVGASWRGRGEWGPFADPKEGISTRLLPPDGHGFPDPAPRALPVWDPTDPLADLFRVWYGRYDVSTKHGAHLSTWYSSTAEPERASHASNRYCRRSGLHRRRGRRHGRRHW
jgi:hypothetical protein